MKWELKMLSINLIERILIESVYKEEKSFDSIITDTHLPHAVIENCIITLLAKNILIKKLDKYYLNENLSKEATQAITSESEKLKAKKLILSEIISHSHGDNINFFKVAMSEREEKILNGLIYNVEEFLKSLSTNKSTKTTNEQIIFWGESKYGKVINHLYS